MYRLTALVLVSTFGTAAFASDTASHNVTVTVSAINEIAITGGDVTLTIDSADAAGDLNAEFDTATSLSWTTNETGKKVTVETDNASPAYLLTVEATSVTGGATKGIVTPTTSPVDFVDSISETAGGCTLSYTADASATAGTGSDVHVITYTIIDV